MRKENTRRDIASRKAFPRDRLFRLVLTPEGLRLDLDRSQPGRGIYLLRDKKTLEFAQRKGLLQRYDKKDLSPLFQQMEAEL